jgi:hypothetical protein
MDVTPHNFLTEEVGLTLLTPPPTALTVSQFSSRMRRCAKGLLHLLGALALDIDVMAYVGYRLWCDVRRARGGARHSSFSRSARGRYLYDTLPNSNFLSTMESYSCLQRIAAARTSMRVTLKKGQYKWVDITTTFKVRQVTTAAAPVAEAACGLRATATPRCGSGRHDQSAATQHAFANLPAVLAVPMFASTNQA